MTMPNRATGSLAGMAILLTLVAVPAEAGSHRMRRPAMPRERVLGSVRPAVLTETPEQERARLNEEQAAAAQAQNDKNAADKAAYEAQVAADKASYEAAVAARDAEIARQKAAHDAAMAKWQADTEACQKGDRSRCGTAEVK